MLGGPHKVTDLYDKDIVQASQFALKELASRENSVRVDKLQLVAVWTQVVAGLKYILEFDTGDNRRVKIEVLQRPGATLSYQLLKYNFV